MAITAETVFNGFKNKDNIKTTLHSVQPGPNTVARWFEEMSGDVDRKVARQGKANLFVEHNSYTRQFKVLYSYMLKVLSHCEYCSA